ncbi:uncharacterized protein J3D65DRAFT_671317 [Phyllosticta citribraziliensis]|uniref:RING-type domain-containing protein n=1 Tax=Phyllosticta citribraziliensis TaxID=989973 RepID=A0ABR1L8G0_9PEZI
MNSVKFSVNVPFFTCWLCGSEADLGDELILHAPCKANAHVECLEWWAHHSQRGQDQNVPCQCRGNIDVHGVEHFQAPGAPQPPEEPHEHHEDGFLPDAPAAEPAPDRLIFTDPAERYRLALEKMENSWRDKIESWLEHLREDRLQKQICAGRRGTLFPCTWNGLVIDTSPNTPADKMMLIKGELVMPERDRPLRRIKYLFFWQNEDAPLTDVVRAVSSVAFENFLELSRGLWQPKQVAGMIELQGRRGGFGDRPAKEFIKHGGTFWLHLSPLAHLAP